jgi:hypothetical protein
MTREEFVSFFAPIWAFRFDLEDALTQELKEWRDELKDMSPDDDYTNLAECVNESLENYGYPTMPIEMEDA